MLSGGPASAPPLPLLEVPRPTDALPLEANRRVVLGDGGGTLLPMPSALPWPPPPSLLPRVALRLRLLRRIRCASPGPPPPLASGRYGWRRCADDDRPGLAGGAAPPAPAAAVEAAALGVVGGSIPARPVPGADGSPSRPPPLLRCLCRRMICSSSGDMPALLLDGIVLLLLLLAIILQLVASNKKTIISSPNISRSSIGYRADYR